MKTIDFVEKDVKHYLDSCIRVWREKRQNGDKFAVYYIDAYQSVRVSLFGSLLPAEKKENEMKKHFEKQLKDSNPITKENLEELQGKSLYSNYQVGDQMLCFLEQKVVDAENTNMILMTVVPRELDLLAGDFEFDRMSGFFPVLIRKENKNVANI